MESTYSRSYLQSIPEKRKQDTINRLINKFHPSLVNNAADGKTSYMIDVSVWDTTKWEPHSVKFTRDELIAGIESRYPDCSVSYQEIWVDVGINSRTLKKGIVIDWS
jgi:hypothetical protein